MLKNMSAILQMEDQYAVSETDYMLLNKVAASTGYRTSKQIHTRPYRRRKYRSYYYRTRKRRSFISIGSRNTDSFKRD